MERDAFHLSYLSDKIPEAAFHGQVVKTVAYLRVSTAQPDVAGTERVAQVEQQCRLPKAVIELGAQLPDPLRIRPQEARRPRRSVAAQDADGSSKGLATGDTSMSSVRSIRGE